MTTTKRTPVRELIDSLNIAMKTQIKTEHVEQMLYDMLEFEKWVIAEAYEKALTNITNGVSMDGLQYYETTFDNQ
jgi:hypothetical protein